MSYNVTQRALHLSAIALHVAPTASREEIVDKLTEITGVPGETWLSTTSHRPLPDDLGHVRAITAARLLTCQERPARTQAVLAFLSADYKMPELERLLPPATEENQVGVQLSLVS